MSRYNDASVAIGAAEQLCTCPKCIEARASKGLSDCYKAQLARNVHDKVLGLCLATDKVLGVRLEALIIEKFIKTDISHSHYVR